MKGTHIPYSREEREWLAKHRDLVRSDLHRLFVTQFRRDDVSQANIKSYCTRQGWKTGRTGCFEAGIVPHNKGKKMPFNANTAATQFKKGSAPKNRNFIGHERLSKDGYVEISVDETNPYTGHSRRYRLKHKWAWEQANGPVPKGMALKCLDGDRTNCDPANWILVSRSMLPRLSGRWTVGYDDAPAELKPVILAVATLESITRDSAA